MKFAAFFGKLWLKTQSATKKVWALAKLHKVISIASAATVVAGTTCAIALPIALHNHEYSEKWSFDTKNHWHEASCDHEDERSDVAPHTYTNACDLDCDVCGKTRSVTHTYDNACDTTCNVCGEVREKTAHVFFNICDTDCNICGEVREVGDHVYDDSCDTVCNACGEKREITHTYDNECDTTCNVCDYERTTKHNYMPGYSDDDQHWYQCTGCGDKYKVTDHIYDNNCDTTCNSCDNVREIKHVYASKIYKNASKHWYECTVCGEKKDEAVHVYDNDCDNICDVCNITREVPDHVYDDDCDTDCEVCGGVREIEHAYEIQSNDDKHWYECKVCHVTKEDAAHYYDHSCDTTCNKCGAVRVVEDHPYNNYYTTTLDYHWLECSVCMQRKDMAEHVYTSDCDTTCNVCGRSRTVDPHKYDNACDKICNVENCGYEREVDPHVYTNDCDTTCNVCGNERTIEHKYVLTSNDDNHWNECSVCHDKVEVAIHVYTSDCDTTCNICNKDREVPGHVYDNACDKICNVENCGYERDVDPHVYTSDCDTDCNVCGVTREVQDHVYDNACDEICNVENCGYKRDVDPHPYATTYTYDAENHWLVCGECGNKDSVAAHVYTSDCDTTCNVCENVRAVEDHKYDNACDKVCNVENCDYERAVDPHPYATTYTYDAENHWRVCSVCGEKDVTKVHTYDHDCTVCDTCGRERTIAHKYETKYTDEKHWDDCTECEVTTEPVAHKCSPCDGKCNDCDFKEDKVAYAHEYDENEFEIGEGEDAGYHWNVCTAPGCSAKVNKSLHNYITIHDVDYHWSKCDICGCEQRDYVEHEWSDELCSDNSVNHYYECSGCDRRKDEANHGDPVKLKNDTHHWMACPTCGYITVQPVEHDYCAYQYDGVNHWRICNDCGSREEGTHEGNYSDGYRADDTTHWKTCKCGYRDTEFHDKIQKHDEIKHWDECTVCANTYDVKDHDFNKKIEEPDYLKAPATESSKAVYYLACGVCGQKGTEDNDTWEKPKNEASIEIVISDKTYDGNPLSFTYTTNSDCKIDNIKVEHKLDGAAEFAEYKEGKIKNAGKYIIKITVPETIEYDRVEKEIDVTIEKATLTLEWIVKGLYKDPDTGKLLTPFDGQDKRPTVEINGVVDGDNVTISLEILVAKQKVYSNGYELWEFGDPDQQNQEMRYKATLGGIDEANYVVVEGNDTFEYRIDACVHGESDEYGFCTFCDEYAFEIINYGDSFEYDNGYSESAVLYCAFAVPTDNPSDYSGIMFKIDMGNWYDYFEYSVYVKDGDNMINIDPDQKLINGESVYYNIGDYGKTIYFVITVDEYISEIGFDINYYTQN